MKNDKTIPNTSDDAMNGYIRLVLMEIANLFDGPVWITNDVSAAEKTTDKLGKLLARGIEHTSDRTELFNGQFSIEVYTPEVLAERLIKQNLGEI